MKVLVVNGIDWVGGAEAWIVDLAQQLLARGHEVGIVHHPRSPLGEGARAAGIQAIALPSGGFTPAVLWLARTVRRERWDVVVATVRGEVPFVGLAARLAGHPGAVARLMNGWPAADPTAGKGWRCRPRRWLHRSLVDHAVSNSRAGEARLLTLAGLPRNRVTSIHNGIDVGRFDPDRLPRGAFRSELDIPASAFLAVSISRFDARKGCAFELEAMGRLVASRPDIHALFAGPVRDRNRGYRDDLCARAADFPGAVRIHFLGARDDVPRILRDTDVLLRCALEEGLPNIALEAMAMRVPVVATGICGTPEAVVDGETGRLVPPGDSQAIFRAVDELVKDPERRAAMGEAGRARVRALFALDRMGDEYERFLARVVASRA